MDLLNWKDDSSLNCISDIQLLDDVQKSDEWLHKTSNTVATQILSSTGVRRRCCLFDATLFLKVMQL